MCAIRDLDEGSEWRCMFVSFAINLVSGAAVYRNAVYRDSVDSMAFLYARGFEGLGPWV